MMAPSLALDGAGPVLAIGVGRRDEAARRARRRRRRHPRRRTRPGGIAVERPRFHRAGDVVNAEPGVDEQALADWSAPAFRCAVGRRCTTTSAASASSAERRCGGSAPERPRRDAVARARRRTPVWTTTRAHRELLGRGRRDSGAGPGHVSSRREDRARDTTPRRWRLDPPVREAQIRSSCSIRRAAMSMPT